MNLTSAYRDPYLLGINLGVIITAILLLAGFVKCASLAEREGAHKKCIWSLGVLCAAMLVSCIVVYGQADSGMKNSSTYHAILRCLSFARWGLIFLAVVLAAIGLINYGNAELGRWQAILTLALGIPLLAINGFVAIEKLPQAREIFGMFARPETLTFPDYNFRYTTPGWPWQIAKSAYPTNDTKIMLVKKDSVMFFTIMPQKVGKLHVTAETWSKENGELTKRKADSYQVLDQKTLQIGGLTGLEVMRQVRRQDLTFFFIQWYCVTNGWGYNLCMWGPDSDRDNITAAAKNVMTGFELLDDQGRATNSSIGIENAGNFDSRNFGFHVQCQNSDWVKWSTMEDEQDSAIFGALQPDGGALIVTAICAQDLPTQPEMVNRTFFALSGLSGKADRSLHFREKNLDVSESTFHRQRESGEDFTFRVKIWQGGGLAYCATAWAKTANPQRDQILDDAMSRVTLPNPLPPPHAASVLTPREKYTSATILNAVGMVYYSDKQYKKSIDFFEKAFAFGDAKTNCVYLANCITAYLDTADYKKAAAEMAQYPKIVSAWPELQADQAQVEFHLGQLDLAQTNYESLFRTGFTSELHFNEYLLLLNQTHQTQRALDEAKAYLAKQDSPLIRLTEINLLKQQKNFGAAFARLDDARAKYPEDEALAYSLGDSYLQASRPTQALKVGEDFLRQEPNSARMHLLDGRALMATSHFLQASNALRAAYILDPRDSETSDDLAKVSRILATH